MLPFCAKSFYTIFLLLQLNTHRTLFLLQFCSLLLASQSAVCKLKQDVNFVACATVSTEALDEGGQY